MFATDCVNIRKESFLLLWCIWESSSPFQGFISYVGIPLASSHLGPFTLQSSLTLQHKKNPPAYPGIRGEAALAGEQPMSNEVAKYVKG